MIDNLRGIVTTDVQPAKQSTDAELPDRPRVKDVARWLGLHQNTIYLWIHRGQIPCKVMGKRTYIFDKALLLEWAKPEQEAA